MLLANRKKLGKNASHRKCMYRNMACSLIEHQCVKTTVVKAKQIRSIVEKLVTRARTNTLHNRRILLKFLNNDNTIVNKLIGDIAPRYMNRNGGYLRVLKCGHRAGDAAPMAYVMFVKDE